MGIKFVVEPDETGKGRLIVDGRFYGLPIEAVEALAQQQKALATLAKYFTSGNCIPVDQATIKAADFWQITGLAPNAAPQPTAGNEATGDEEDDRSHER